MSIENIVNKLRVAGAKINISNGDLIVKLPKNISPTLKEDLIANKDEIKSFLTKIINDEKRQFVKRNLDKSQLTLSFAQQRLWFLDQLNEGSSEYNMPVAFTMKGNFNVEAAEQTLSRIIARHEVLRTVYIESDKGALQRIQETFTFNITLHDLTLFSDDDKELQLQSLLEKDTQTTFNLGEDLMLRASFVLLAKANAQDNPQDNREQEGVLLFNMHHIASDGWSMEVLTKEFFTIYKAFVEGKPDPLPALDVQYADYADWQREWLQGEMLESQLSYWEKQLAAVPPFHSLVLDSPRPEIKQHVGACVSGQLPAETATALQTLARHYQLTPFMLLHGALSLIMSRHSNSTDIVIGTPVANRLQAELEPLIGFFVNTLVLRVDTGHSQLADYLAHVRKVHLEAQSNQDVPFEQLVERLNLPRSTSHTPLFQIMLTTHSDYGLNDAEDVESFTLPGVSLSSRTSDIITSKFDLSINISTNDSGVYLNWTYDKSIFTEAHIQQFNDHMCRLLTGLAALDEKVIAAGPAIKDLPMLSPQELDYLIHTVNDTEADYPKDKCINELFEAQAKVNPDNIALVFEEKQLTYQQLNEQANQLAHYLVEHHDIKPDTLVGICVERSLEMVVGILGILKAGGAYVPLDPAYPKARLDYMLADADVAVVLTQETVISQVDLGERQTILLDSDVCDNYPVSDIEKSRLCLTSSHLAYVIYTSGSTGQPKGVLQTHENVARLFEATNEYFEFSSSDVWTLFHSICFDFSVWELFGAFSYGGRLIVPDFECTRDPKKFIALCEKHQVTVLNQTPSAFTHFSHTALEQAACLSHLRFIVFGGEALQPTILKPWCDAYGYDTPALINMYGITEITVHATFKRITNDDLCKSVLGQRLNDQFMYLLNDMGCAVPLGTQGELYIGGAGLARGYLNQPALTAERFIENPYYDNNTPGSSKRLYKTGDLMCYLPDGNLAFIGRVDEQVKIRGFRIELGEIEYQLGQCEDVDSAIVLARDSDTGSQQLVAYVKLPLTFETTVDESQCIADLRQTLSGHLPEYMVPGVFVLVDEWPLTSNGKVDKKALPAPDGTLFQGEYVAPDTGTEKALTGIWATLLHLDENNISTTTDFFELGGHSLLSIRLVSEIRQQLAVELSVKDIFTSSTIQTLSVCVDNAAETTLRPSVKPVLRDGNELQVSFAQQRLWFIDQLNSGSAEYNMPMAFTVQGDFNVEVAEQTFSRIIARHEVLRTVYTESDEGAQQRIQEMFTFNITRCDLTSCSDDDQELQLQSLLEQDGQAAFNLSEDLMLRASFFLLAKVDAQSNREQAGVLLFNMHHIASDGWSMDVLTKEFFTLYQAFVEGKQDPLPALDIQYADYASWQREWLQGELLESQLSYWDKQLAAVPAVHSLMLDKPRPEIKQYAGACVSGELPAETGSALQNLARHYQLTPFMLLHGALSLVMSRHSNSTDIVIGTPVANRLQAELEPLIGFFVNTLVLRVDTNHSQLADYLAHVRQTHLDAQANQDVPFEQLVERLNLPRSTAHTPLLQIMLTTRGDYGITSTEEAESFTLPRVRLSSRPSETITSKLDLSINISINEAGVYLNWTYDKSIFTEAHIQQFNEHMCRLLSGLASLDKKEIAAGPVINDLAMLSPQELDYLIHTLNDTAADYPKDKCIHELFEAQAKANPNNIALVFEDKQLTYQQLNEKANQVAHYLVEQHDIKPDTLVGICVERSLEIVIGILGILKAGGAYMPLDPSYPKSRLDYMLADADVAVVLAQKGVISLVDLGERQTILLDSDVCDNYPVFDLDKSRLGLTSSHLAYVIYTSGSTGKPKGVMVEHSSANNYLLFAIEHYCQHIEGSVVSTSLNFDATLTSIFSPLGCGKYVQLIQSGVTEIEDLIYVIHHACHPLLFKVTPAHLDVMAISVEKVVNNTLAHTFVVGGEELKLQTLAHWKQGLFPNTTFVNEFGPTEATVGCSVYDVKSTVDDQHLANSVSIGKPIYNTQLFIFNNNVLCPFGAAGELYIGGAGLARGYLNQPELTAERFKDNPYYDKSILNKTPNSSKCLYKTGDLVRYLPDGNLAFIGRIDEQVKIRGFRIEPGEIEYQLGQCKDVDSSIVLVKDNEIGSKQLVAYVKSNLTCETDFDKGEFINNIREALNEHLPDYMVPGVFVLVDEWPLTPNGKVDKKTLPVPDSMLLQGPYVAPQTETEKALVRIWAKLLQIDENKVSTMANFFELGGHSLLSIRLVSEIRQQLAIELSVKDVFAYSTIQTLSDCVDNASETALRPLVKPVFRDGNELSVSFAQQRLWFIDQLNGGSPEYNMPAAFNVQGDFNVKAAEQTLSRIIARHEVLRTVYFENDGGARQRILETFTFNITRYDLTSFSDDDQELQLQSLLEKDGKTAFNLGKDLMLRASFVLLAKADAKDDREQEAILLFNMHHIASDGWSMEVLTKEFFTLYQAFVEGKPDPLPALDIQYADYAHWQKEWLQGEMLESQLSYWDKQLADVPSVHSLVLDNPRPEIKQHVGACVSGYLPPETATALQVLARHYQLTPFMLLHGALSLIMSSHSNSTDIVIGTPLANRLQVELESLIGFFVNTLVLRLDTSHNDLGKYLRHVRQVHLDAQSNQDVPFEQLVERLNLPRNAEHTPLFQIMLTTHGDYRLNSAEEVESFTLPGVSLSSKPTDTITLKFDLDIDININDAGVYLNWTYDKSIFTEAHVQQFNDHMCRLLTSLAALDEKMIAAGPTVKELPMLSPQELNYLIHTVNDTQADYPKDKCIHELFEGQVKATPDNIALVFEDEQLTYQQLNEKANQLAHYLVEHHDIKPDMLVGICVERSLNMIIGVLGILKAGGVYVPIDIKYHPDVIKKRIEDISLNLVLTSNLSNSNFKHLFTVNLNNPDVVVELNRICNENPIQLCNSSHLAYALTTSGTTGKPKLIGMSHTPLVNLIYGMKENCQDINGVHSVLQFASLSFDMSFTDVFLALLQGGELNLISEEIQFDVKQLTKIIMESKCSIINLPYSMLQSFVNYSNENELVFNDLSVVISTAERLVVTAEIRQFFTRHLSATLVNHFGPSETHVCTSNVLEQSSKKWDPIPSIGRPISNVQCYVLTDKQELAPYGAIGELFVGGTGLARGYLNNDTLTSEKFVSNPFIDGETELMYCTGDLVRWLNNGDLEYFGRKDNQIKLRGFRIEIGAIESALSDHSQVRDCCVTLDEQQERLLAYVVADRDKDLSSELNEYLIKILPVYMVPHLFIVIDSLPLNINGKVDKKLLPKPNLDLYENGFVAPETDIEKSLVGIWSKLLKIEEEKISTTANFFELGGHSLLVMRLIYMINSQWKIEGNVKQYFDSQTILSQSTVIMDEILLTQSLLNETNHIIDIDNEKWEL